MIDDMVLEAVFAENHSMGETFLSYVCHNNDVDVSDFLIRPIARVKVIPVYKGKVKVEGWVLLDVDTGHRWLTFGTDYSEENAASHAFYYTPDLDAECIDLPEGYIHYREKYPEEVIKYPSWFNGNRI